MNPLYNMPAMSQNTVAGAQTALDRARQLAQMMQNPQQLIANAFPGIPQGIQNNPVQILQWLQQTGRVTPQQIQLAQQLASMR